MFTLKKILGHLLLPLPLCLALALVGCLLLCWSRRQRLGKVLVTIATLTLAMLSFDVTTSRLIGSLERIYPALDPATLAHLAPQHAATDASYAIRWIVVLGGGHATDANLPALSQVSETTRTRLLEGIRFLRALPGSRLIVSGGAYLDPVPEAVVMAQVARLYGVDDHELVLESQALDTEEEAALIQPMVGRDRFVLVTSACHLPRAMALFVKRGMDPLPAPVDFQDSKPQTLYPRQFFPNTRSLSKAERAIHELLGLAWARLKGSI
jgi:uncharacterized SAM-binding protein YcdF (DUF218 family)